MADYLPRFDSLWSTTTWITAFSNLTAFAGTPPMSADDVYADGKTITIDTNINVASLRTTTAPRTGGAAGGGFRATNNTSLTANLLAGTTTVLTFASAAPNSFTLIGNIPSGRGILNTSSGLITIVGGVTGSLDRGIFNNSTGTIIVSGNIVGSGEAGLDNNAGGKAFIYGNVFSFGTVALRNNSGSLTPPSEMTIYGNLAGGFSSNAYGVFNTAILTIYGNLTGGMGNNSHAVLNDSRTANTFCNVVGNILGQVGAGVSIGEFGGLAGNTTTGTLNVTGTVFRSGVILGVNAPVNVVGNVIGDGAVAITNGGGGRITVLGNAIGGSANAINNSAAGFVYVKRIVGAPGGPTNPSAGTAAGVSNSQNGLVYVEEMQYGAQGASPVSGPVFLVNRPNSVLVMEGPPPTFTETTLFGNLNVPNLFPPVSSVRSGITFGNGDFTGRMVVPPRESVQIGVPVDNTVGTFVLSPESFWTFKRSNSAINDPTTIGYRIKNLATIPSVGSLIGSFNVATISGYSL